MEYKINYEVTATVELTHNEVVTLVHSLEKSSLGYEGDHWKAADALLRDFRELDVQLGQGTAQSPS